MGGFARLITFYMKLIRYRLDKIILANSFLKKLNPLIYLSFWRYLYSDKLSDGKRIRLTLESLGPIFIKFGQTISTRKDLLPEEIAKELAKLQDKCPPFPASESQAIIEKGLGDSVENLFSSFEKTPLSSASIAQIHTAVTIEGENIIIKVVRPSIEKQIARDLKLLYFFASIIDKAPNGKRLRLIEVVSIFEKIIYNELNMMIEAANASLLRENFKDSDLLYVPKVYWNLCRENILVTERIYGTPISDIKTLKRNKVNLKKLSEKGVIIFFSQVFEHNFFHADMHPGNIFVGKNEKYLGVDFGIMGSLSDQDRHYLAKNLLAFFNQDYKAVAQAHIESSWAPKDINIIEFENAIRSVCEPIFKKPLNKISFGTVLLNLFKEAKRFDIYIQPQLLLLYKTMLNIEGLGRDLYPELDLWSTAKPFLEKITEEKYNNKAIFEKFYKKIPEALYNAPKLPTLIIKTLEKIIKEDNTDSKQTEIITKQLQENSKKQKKIILSGIFLILSAIFLIESLYVLSCLVFIIAIILLLKSN